MPNYYTTLYPQVVKDFACDTHALAYWQEHAIMKGKSLSYIQALYRQGKNCDILVWADKMVEIRDYDALVVLRVEGHSLAHVDFRRRLASLPHVVFAGHDLTGADFSDMSLRNAHFEGACLAGVDFTGADLESCSFDHADMGENAPFFNGANLKHAWFTGCRNFASVDLSQVSSKNLEGCRMPDGRPIEDWINDPFEGFRPTPEQKIELHRLWNLDCAHKHHLDTYPMAKVFGWSTVDDVPPKHLPALETFLALHRSGKLSVPSMK